MSLWQWIACGKHPAAKDYIRLGNQSSLGGTFFEWIEQGYARICLDNPGLGRVLWRFWLRGTIRGQLSCGVMRQSGDAIGRPYPLLIMGSGSSPSWEECWEHLPFACANVWNQADALSSIEFETVPKLLQGLERLTAPAEILQDDTLPPVLPLRALIGNIGSEFGLFSLEAPNGSFIATAAAMHLSLLLKNKNASPPVAIFIGGGETAWLAFMRRPLKTGDFTTLWDQHQQIIGENDEPN